MFAFALSAVLVLIPALAIHALHNWIDPEN